MFGGVSTVFSNNGYHSASALRWNREADAPTMKHPIVGNKYINIFFIKQLVFLQLLWKQRSSFFVRENVRF